MAIAKDIMKLISDNGFGDVGTDIFSYKWGKRKCAQILVVPTGGPASPLKELYRNPTFQILVRGDRQSDHNLVYEKAESIYNLLVNQPPNTMIGDNCYKGFDPQSDIGSLGEDDNERAVFSMNFDTYI